MDKHFDAMFEKQLEDLRSRQQKIKESTKRILARWVEIIDQVVEGGGLTDKKILLPYNGGFVCTCRMGDCECYPVSPDYVKEFLASHFRTEVKEFVRKTRVEADPDCYGADYYQDCWVVFGENNDEKIARLERELKRLKRQ